MAYKITRAGLMRINKGLGGREVSKFDIFHSSVSSPLQQCCDTGQTVNNGTCSDAEAKLRTDSDESALTHSCPWSLFRDTYFDGKS